MTTEQKREVYNVFRNELNLAFDSVSADELNDILDCNDDSYITIDGEEYRLIHEENIRDIAQEEISECVKECYLSQSTEPLPWWIRLDWNQTVQNCIDADGYGHHFSSYDGNEYEAGGWYIFRTN